MTNSFPLHGRLWAGAAMALSAALGWSLPAGAGVTTGVRIVGTQGQTIARAYNSANLFATVGAPYPTPPGDTGLYTCYYGCGGAFPDPVTTGTTDTTGAASSAFDTLSGVDAPTASDASATAAANESNGTLRETASGTFGYVYGGEDQSSLGQSSAALYDTLTFNVAGANAQTTTDITLNYQLDGAVSGLQFKGFEQAQIFYLIQLGSTAVQQQGGWVFASTDPDALTFGPLTQHYGISPVALLGVEALSDTPTDTDLKITYQITGSSVSAGFYDALALSCGDGPACDYANTARISFSLPSNVSLSSASGAFLTSTVPEPAAWALMMAGLGGLGATLRSRRRTAMAMAMSN